MPVKDQQFEQLGARQIESFIRNSSEILWKISQSETRVACGGHAY
jgi:hypothetical protein